MKRTLAVAAICSLLLLAGSAQAHTTIEATAPQGPFVRGETYTVPTTAYINCAVIGAEYSEGQELVFSIANAADIPWINATETTQAISAFNCEPGTAAGTPGLYNILSADVEFTISDLAPAFLGPVMFQPGAFGETNQGGDFEVEVAYEPTFSASLAQTSYDYEEGSGIMTVLVSLENTANADSVFQFGVTSELPDGVVAHIQDTLTAPAPYLDGVASSLHTVELHFSAGAADHSEHEGMEGMDHDAMDAMESAWESLDITLGVSLAAKDDPTLVSEVQELQFTVNKVAAEDHHDDGHHDEHGDESFLESVGVPGPGIALLIGALGVVAIARRK